MGTLASSILDNFKVAVSPATRDSDGDHGDPFMHMHASHGTWPVNAPPKRDTALERMEIPRREKEMVRFDDNHGVLPTQGSDNDRVTYYVGVKPIATYRFSSPHFQLGPQAGGAIFIYI
jgi:hypothetical protein